MEEYRPFDCVLMVGFGGPNGLADVGPFLANVVRGKRVPRQRLDEVAANYMRFGGVSPLTEVMRGQAAKLERRLDEIGLHLPVFVGMRNWHPFLADTLREISDARLSHAIGFIAAPHHSYSSCRQYKENVLDARRQIVAEGYTDIAITYVDSWYDHPLFIETLYRHTLAAIEQLPSELRPSARIVFTAHSLPVSSADKCKYVEQLTTSASLVMQRLNHHDAGSTRHDWTLVYQSRSGLPTDAWLEPDIRDYLKAETPAAAVIVPIGFFCDNLEVLFDLDTIVARLCRELNLPMVRASTPGNDPLFVEMMADLITKTYQRFARYPVLPIVGR